MTDKLIAEIDTTLASLKKPHWCDTGAGSCSICQSRKMMIDLLHQCRDRMRWVPCSERLPEEGDYLCFYASGNIEVIEWDGEFWLDSSLAVCAPTHWSELPQPPQQEQQEQGE